jgi:hypothetical protein
MVIFLTTGKIIVNLKNIMGMIECENMVVVQYGLRHFSMTGSARALHDWDFYSKIHYLVNLFGNNQNDSQGGRGMKKIIIILIISLLLFSTLSFYSTLKN